MDLKNIDDINYYEFSNLSVPNYFFIKPLNFLPTLDKEELNGMYKKIEPMVGSKVALVTQKHTNIIKKVTLDNYDIKDEADGMITNVEGISLAIKVADCQAIYLYDDNKKVIGNVHSGWKGTVNKIIKNAIDIMVNDYDCNTNDIKVYICPSIAGCDFEVDLDVYSIFKNSFTELDVDNYVSFKTCINKYYIDCLELNKDYLITLGIKENNINLCDICTVCEGDTIHSYRYDKDKSGRNLAVISL